MTDHMLIADSAGRSLGVEIYDVEDELLAIQTWTVGNSAQAVSALTGYSAVARAAYAVAVSITAGASIYLLPSDAAVTVTSANGHRLVCGDPIGPAPALVPTNFRPMFIQYGGDLGLVTAISTSINSGGRAATPGVIDSRNYPSRAIRLCFLGTPGVTVTSGALTLEAYESIDGVSTWETSPSVAIAIPCVASTAFRVVRELPPGMWKIDANNALGSTLASVSINVNHIWN